MAGTASARFYWSDWLSDPCLRLCSHAARGIWMDMLCIAAEADPVGYVLVNGRTPDARMLARITGALTEEIEGALTELETNGVFSRDAHGRMFSRRMVRDAQKAATAKANGSQGGSPLLVNKGKITALDNQNPTDEDNQKDNPASQEADNLLRVQVKDKEKGRERGSGGKGVGRPGYPPDAFEVWYGAYPRRVAPKAARKAFARIVRTGEVPFERLMAVTRAFAAACAGKEPEFIAHPATWLNAGRWADETAPSSPAMVVSREEFARQSGRFYFRPTDPQYEAWSDHQRRTTGTGANADRDGGWWFDAEWPPERQEAAE